MEKKKKKDKYVAWKEEAVEAKKVTERTKRKLGTVLY